MENDKEKFKKEFKQRLYKFVLRLIKIVNTLPFNGVTKVISYQILRSGTSILANYVEAQGASSKKEFTNYFHYAFKSANETEIWLNLLRDTGNGEEKEIGYLIVELNEIIRMFAASILTLKGKR